MSAKLALLAALLGCLLAGGMASGSGVIELTAADFEEKTGDGSVSRRSAPIRAAAPGQRVICPACVPKPLTRVDPRPPQVYFIKFFAPWCGGSAPGAGMPCRPHVSGSVPHVLS
jgi:hypothetical protein